MGGEHVKSIKMTKFVRGQPGDDVNLKSLHVIIINIVPITANVTTLTTNGVTETKNVDLMLS